MVGISNIGIWKLGSKTQHAEGSLDITLRYFKYRYLEAWKQNPTVAPSWLIAFPVFQISVFGSLEAKPNPVTWVMAPALGISNIGIWKLGSKTQRIFISVRIIRRYFKYRYLEAWKQNPTCNGYHLRKVRVFQISVFGSLEAKPNVSRIADVHGFGISNIGIWKLGSKTQHRYVST